MEFNIFTKEELFRLSEKHLVLAKEGTVNISSENIDDAVFYLVFDEDGTNYMSLLFPKLEDAQAYSDLTERPTKVKPFMIFPVQN